jgi:hypothetical protein
MEEVLPVVAITHTTTVVVVAVSEEDSVEGNNDIIAIICIY